MVNKPNNFTVLFPIILEAEKAQIVTLAGSVSGETGFLLPRLHLLAVPLLAEKQGCDCSLRKNIVSFLSKAPLNDHCPKGSAS